jgi:hypothetical protein
MITSAELRLCEEVRKVVEQGIAIKGSAATVEKAEQ